jgi:hypothetical protein
LAEAAEVIMAFRAAADALEAALALAHKVRQQNWPSASEDVDLNVSDRFDDGLTSEARVGAKWVITDLRDVASDLDPNDTQAAEWVKALAAGRIGPRVPAAPRDLS